MLFRYDSPVMQFMAKLFDLILLNLLFLACCLPVVTIGASCAALHDVSLKNAAGEEPPVIVGFFGAFKKNFGQATLTWLILLAAAGFLYVDLAFSFRYGTGGWPLRLLLLAASATCFAASLYIFPIQARYRNTIRANFRNALLLAIRHLPKTALLAATVLVPLALLLYGPVEVFLLLAVLWLLVGFALIAGIQDRVLLKVFRLYEPDRQDTEA